jgi:hypothetical protein
MSFSSRFAAARTINTAFHNILGEGVGDELLTGHGETRQIGEQVGRITQDGKGVRYQTSGNLHHDETGA